MTIVECTDVKKTYQQGKVDVHALRGVSVLINKGEFIALAGPSGSGKTTLLNMIGGLDLADSGRIVVDGNAFDQMSQSQLADLRLHNIGFIFQAYNLIPVLTAIENVEYVMLLQKIPITERRDRAQAILDEVGLAGKYNRRPAELSGGQQQRVAVARAVVAEPKIILADEPTGNLDSTHGNEVMKLLVDLNENGTTVVMVTHSSSYADFAHRVIHLFDGHIVTENLKETYQQRRHDNKNPIDGSS
jgi:putative ABC transport system ATP-binding protein